MTRFLLIILVSISAACLNAQSDLEALWIVWCDTSMADQERLDALVEVFGHDTTLTIDHAVNKIFDPEVDVYPEVRDEQVTLANYAKGLGLANNNRHFESLRYLQNVEYRFISKGDDYFISTFNLRIGTIFTSLGQSELATDYLTKAHKGFLSLQDTVRIFETLVRIANNFSLKGDEKQFDHVMLRAHDLMPGLDPISQFECLIRLSELDMTGVISYEEKEEYWNRAVSMVNAGIVEPNIKFLLGKAEFELYNKNCASAIAMIDSAMHYAMLNDYPDTWISYLYAISAEGYLCSRQYGEAKRLAEIGLKLAEENNLRKETQDNLIRLMVAYEELGEMEHALNSVKKYYALQDSMNSEVSAAMLNGTLLAADFKRQQITDSLQQEEEKLKLRMAHQQEVARKERDRNLFLSGGVILLILAIGLYSRMRFVRRAKVRIEKEKDRSENLLLNILPAEIAQELKEKGRADARDFDMVSILFSDFKGFTLASEKLSAHDLVSEINTCFEAFDGIMGKYGIEKIKTIGDAYMAAGGLPVPTEDSVKNTVLAALEMQAFISKRKSDMDAVGKPAFEMRVGIHTGPVVAGIVGIKKFQYDIWGDTVNTASRMESSGEVGRVNISEATYELVKDDTNFSLESRGKIKAKGKGEIEMFFVSKA